MRRKTTNHKGKITHVKMKLLHGIDHGNRCQDARSLCSVISRGLNTHDTLERERESLHQHNVSGYQLSSTVDGDAWRVTLGYRITITCGKNMILVKNSELNI